MEVAQSCLTLCDPHGLYSPWDPPGQNTGVGSLSLLQGIFPTYGSNPGLPHCRWILYQLSHRNIWVFVEKALCSPLSDLSIPWLGDSNGEMVAIPPPIHLWKAWTTFSYLSLPSRMHKVPRSRVTGSFLHPYYCDRVSSLDEVRLHVTLDSRISCCLLSPSPWGENGELCSRGEEVSHFIVACVSWWATGLLCRKTLWNSLDLRERTVIILPCKVSSSEHSLAARDCLSVAIGHP